MVSIVIPAFNEEACIGHTISKIGQILHKSGCGEYEILVVDDGSDDATQVEAYRSGAIIISHPHNIGYGRSLKDGIAAAKYDQIVITDADGTYPLEAIPDLIDCYKQGYDLVVGARMGKYYDESFIKFPLRIILKLIVEFTTNRKIPDINSGLRVFSKRQIITFFPHLCDTFSFTTSMTLAYMMTGKFVKYVPITYNQRVGKTKVRLFKDSLLTLQYIIEMATYYNPLRIFMLASILSGLLASISIGIGIITHIRSLFELGVGLLVISVLLLALGLLAVLLKQIMDK